MKIQIGEVYMDATNNKTPFPNKTYKYLLPCLKEYGEVFKTKVSSVFKVAIGLGDIVVNQYGTTAYERHVFILIDAGIAPAHFIKFLDWIRQQPMYENDYVYDDIQKSTYHMVVIKLPEQYHDSFEIFKKGKYSEMYQKETIEKLFENRPDEAGILLKKDEYKIRFTKRLNKFLNNVKVEDQIKPDQWEGDLDFPPTEESETFNTHLK